MGFRRVLLRVRCVTKQIKPDLAVKTAGRASNRVAVMPLVPPYIDALRPYEAGRDPQEVARSYGLERVSSWHPTRTRSELRRWR